MPSVLCAAIRLAWLVRHLCFVLLHVQACERADLHALVVLIQLRLGEAQRLLLHLHVFLRVNEFVIGIFDGGDGGDDLLPQSLLASICNRFLVDPNRQPRLINPEVFQQRLRESDANLPLKCFQRKFCRTGVVSMLPLKVVLQTPRHCACRGPN